MGAKHHVSRVAAAVDFLIRAGTLVPFEIPLIQWRLGFEEV
jgi:hypothetical protein